MSLPLRQSRLVAPPATSCIWIYIYIYFSPSHASCLSAHTWTNGELIIGAAFALGDAGSACLYIYIFFKTSSSQSVEWTPFCRSRNLPHMSNKSMPGVRYRLAVLLFAVLHRSKVCSCLGTTFLPTVWSSSKPHCPIVSVWTPQKPVQSVMSTIWPVASKTLELTTKN